MCVCAHSCVRWGGPRPALGVRGVRACPSARHCRGCMFVQLLPLPRRGWGGSGAGCVGAAPLVWEHLCVLEPAWEGGLGVTGAGPGPQCPSATKWPALGPRRPSACLAPQGPHLYMGRPNSFLLRQGEPPWAACAEPSVCKGLMSTPGLLPPLLALLLL